jgi:hypothetical protein
MQSKEDRALRAILLKSPGHSETRYSAHVPLEGEVVSSLGSQWIVRHVESDADPVVCTLELASERYERDRLAWNLPAPQLDEDLVARARARSGDRVS